MTHLGSRHEDEAQYRRCSRGRRGKTWEKPSQNSRGRCLGTIFRFAQSSRTPARCTSRRGRCTQEAGAYSAVFKQFIGSEMNPEAKTFGMQPRFLCSQACRSSLHRIPLLDRSRFASSLRFSSRKPLRSVVYVLFEHTTSLNSSDTAARCVEC